MSKTSIFMVLGDNGSGNSGNAVFGLYPTQSLAEKRLKHLEHRYENGEDGAEYMWITQVFTGPQGVDCCVPVEG